MNAQMRVAEALRGVLRNNDVAVSQWAADEIHVSYPTRITQSVVASLQDLQDTLNVVQPSQGDGWTVRLEAAHDRVIFTDRPDPLAKPVPLPTLEDSIDLGTSAGVQIGLCEDGSPLRIPLMGGAHVLVAGATGAGKGSILWGVVRGLAKMVKDGRVRLWLVDPKGGQEFGALKGIAHRFAVTDEETLELLREACAVLTNKAAWFGQQGDREVTSADLSSPTHRVLDLIIIDELAALTDNANAKVRSEVVALTSKIMRQGRSAAMTLVAATQDPRQRVIPNRSGFTYRVALRLNEASETNMVLGHGARAQGALADLIPYSMPGTCYVVRDGHAGALRGRAAYVPDHHIQALAQALSEPVQQPQRVSRTHEREAQTTMATGWRRRGLSAGLREFLR